jgi:hypothetical protein
VVIGGARDQDAAWLGQCLQAGRDIDAVSIKVGAFDDNIAEIDADPQQHLVVIGCRGIGRRHALLQLDGAGDRMDGAAELDQHAVAHYLDNAAAVLGHQRLEDLLAPPLQLRQRPGLIQLHEPAVADHVGGEDGAETAFQAQFSLGRKTTATRCADLSRGREVGLSLSRSRTTSV